MKFTLAAVTVIFAASSASAQETVTPPAYGNCSQAVSSAWVIGTDARNCTQQAKYTPVQFVFPNATIYEAFCPNSFCRSLVANALTFRPAEGDCIVRKTNFMALLYSQIIDPFAKNCKIEPAPVTSKPPVTTAPPPPITAPPAPTTAPPTPTTTRPACA